MRADKYFAERFGSRTKAKDALSKGLVVCRGRALSPDDDVAEGDEFEFLPMESFASRGGDKLERALDFFHADVSGLTLCDLGASTGGFTDVLLRRGAARVYCVDVGERQLEARLAADPRVRVMDRTNARYLTRESFPEPLGGAVCDLSFISLRLILPVLRELLPDGGCAYVLFKPQFECGGKIGKSGILPVAAHGALLKEFRAYAAQLGFGALGIVNAPILPKKNIEYVVALCKNVGGMGEEAFLAAAKKLL